MQGRKQGSFTIDEIASGTLPAVMRLAEFCDGVGINRRYGQRLAQEGRIPARLVNNRYFVDTRAALAMFGIDGGEA